MLAERRSKANYVLNPKNNTWIADETNFGKKLMEKMGWSSGKGLGKDEQGDTQHIRVNYKNDSKGMGYAGPVDDPVLHQNDFADLLAELNGAQEPPPVTLDVSSLEKRSESSKSRVHYKKFTRGKDLSRYSSKDLQCIIGTGKKKEKPKEEIVVKAEIGSEDHSHGVETVSGGLMADYFRKKMTEKGLWKAPVKKEEVDNDSGSKSDEEIGASIGFGFKMNEEDEDMEQKEDSTEKKKKKKKKGKDGPAHELEIKQEVGENEDFCKSSNDEEIGASFGFGFKMNEEDEDTGQKEDFKDKKKNKKKKGKDVPALELEIKQEVGENKDFCKSSSSKKSKKEKSAAPLSTLPDVKILSEGEIKKQKKKKKAKVDSQESDEVIFEQIVYPDVVEIKKKKKRANVNNATEKDEVIECEIIDEQPSKKKRKKNKSKAEGGYIGDGEDINKPECDTVQQGQKSKKKKRKVAV